MYYQLNGINIMKRYNVWHFEGYAGGSDYNGPEDVNYVKDFVVDTSMTKQDIIEMFYSKWKNADNVKKMAVYKCELIKTRTIDE